MSPFRQKIIRLTNFSFPAEVSRCRLGDVERAGQFACKKWVCLLFALVFFLACFLFRLVMLNVRTPTWRWRLTSFERINFSMTKGWSFCQSTSHTQTYQYVHMHTPTRSSTREYLHTSTFYQGSDPMLTSSFSHPTLA